MFNLCCFVPCFFVVSGSVSLGQVGQQIVSRGGRSTTGMMRWLVSIASLILVNGANLEVSEQAWGGASHGKSHKKWVKSHQLESGEPK